MFTLTKEFSVDDIYNLEKNCFPNDYWSKDIIQSDIEKSLYVVCTINNNIVGYACASFVLEDAEINRICVCKEFRKQGAGRMLLKELLCLLKEKKCTKVYLEVRSQNKSAILLYNSVGFTEVSKRRNYYHNPDDDAVLMSLDI